ncbi:hypothetical protein Aglo01_22900 [Actinokineospora globicatena]|nr:hypothetical protein Aglo01_22900 [Actinokineospora globicatena]GLW85524.1 hypothetical protein Aglo02_31640 [Actinokineospora globicatena]
MVIFGLLPGAPSTRMSSTEHSWPPVWVDTAAEAVVVGAALLEVGRGFALAAGSPGGRLEACSELAQAVRLIPTATAIMNLPTLRMAGSLNAPITPCAGWPYRTGRGRGAVPTALTRCSQPIPAPSSVKSQQAPVRTPFAAVRVRPGR